VGGISRKLARRRVQLGDAPLGETLDGRAYEVDAVGEVLSLGALGDAGEFGDASEAPPYDKTKQALFLYAETVRDLPCRCL